VNKLQGALARLSRDADTGIVSIVDTDDLLRVIKVASAVAGGYGIYSGATLPQGQSPTAEDAKKAIDAVRNCAFSSVHEDPDGKAYYVVAPAEAVSVILKYVESS